MATRVRLDLDAQTFGRLVATAVAEQRPADWQAEVILRRALGTWEEGRVGYDVLVTASSPEPHPPAKREAEHAPA
jgi:hypothetical protein